MLDKNQIRSYAWSSNVFFSGNELFGRKCAEICDIVSDGRSYDIRARVNDPEDGRVYESRFVIGGDMSTVIMAKCSCRSRCDAFGYCKHVCAAMLQYSDQNGKLSPSAKRFSSPEVSMLIKSYNSMAENDAVNQLEPEKLELVPELEMTNNSLLLSLKIGRKRKYVVRNIPHLLDCFNNNICCTYGKDLTIEHDADLLDEKNRRLLDYISILSHTESAYRYIRSEKKYLSINALWLEKLLNIVSPDAISFMGRPYSIKHGNIHVSSRLEKVSEQMYRLTVTPGLCYLGKGMRSVFADMKEHIFYLCDPDFSRRTDRFFYAAAKSGYTMEISQNDINAFFSAVLTPIRDDIGLEYDDELSDIIPPEAVIRLYIDSPSPDAVYGRLEYTYGERTFGAFSDDRKNDGIRDIHTEILTENMVKRYFSVSEGDAHHPLSITSSDDIYRLFSEGISALSKHMEIYASDRFNRMAIRPPVHASVGVRPESGLLDLDISADGYDRRELAQMLSSYRRGLKYHRLRDGSFIDLDDDSLQEFAEILNALDISDRALLKEKITVPRYRMLYLDSLAGKTQNIRLKRSAEFKDTVRAFSDIASAEYNVPSELEKIMREYQKYGFRWMKTISAYGFGGVLADDMGLGKTLQSIALMLSAKQEYPDRHIKSLVVCPSSLTLNWEREIRRFAPSLIAVTVIGTAAVRAEKLHTGEDADVYITSYSMLTRDILEYEDITFDLHFIDEAQFIKNHNTQSAKAVKGIHSRIRFALTGTPVENSLAELWSIYDFIMPGYLFNYNHFKKTYETPIVKDSSESSVRALRRLTSPFILRRLKRDVLTELPDKTEISLCSDMTEEQHKLYIANVISMKRDLGIEQGNEDRFRILAMLTRLRQICCDPSLVYENYAGGSAKLEQCMELVTSCIESGHKMLLFSQFTSMLAIIEKRLEAAGISYYMLTGSTKAEERLRLVNSFNADSTNVFLISLKAGGTGLNLTGADIVIHYDPWWNLSAENQAADRAYRIGQRSSVTVYKLIAKDSIEEKIQLLQQSKAELADIAVNGEGDITRMSPEDIMSLLG